MRRPQCTHCRKYGHRAAQCPQRDTVKCRGCGELGHTSGLCKKRAEWVCKKCSERGHGSWECAEAQTKAHLRCYLCNEAGHQSVECSNTEKWKCKICNGTGHKPAGCPRGRKYKGQICYACGEKGHLVSQCTEATCFICGLVGHIASRCPAKKKRGPQPICAICGFFGHETWQCLPEWDGTSPKPSANSQPSTPGAERPKQPKPGRAPDNDSYTTAAADHDHDCKCMLCDLVKKRKKAEPSAAKATPQPAEDDRAGSRTKEAHAHEATCICFICLLKRRARGTTGSDPNSEHARTGGDVPSPSGSSAGTPVGNTSPHGPACVCTACNWTRTHDAKQASVEYSQDRAAMLLWNRGTTALASGQIEQAIRLFCECISRDPNAAAFFTSRGDAHMAMKDYSASSGDFQRACELLKVPAPAKAASMLVKVARCRLCLGSHGSAMLAVQEALGIDASADAARTLKRRLARMQEEEAAYQQARAGGRWRAARTAWETCVRLYEEEDCVAPVDVRCWGVDLAVAERAWEKAKSTVDQLFAEAPQAIVVMLAKINLLFLSGELQHALEQAKAALKSDPDNPSFKSARTRIKDVLNLKAQGDARVCSCHYDAALENWRRALELVPDRPEDGGGGLLRARLLIDKAQAELELQRHAEALKSVDASLKLDAAYWRTYLIRGRIHACLELFDAAVDDFKTCLQRSSMKGSGASATDLESLRREVEVTESLAAEAKNTVKDHYKILGLPRTCTLSEIRKAFRTESRKHHPDKGGVEEKFKLVNEAYSTLSDQDAKRAYDAQLGEQALGSTYKYDWGEDTYQNGGDFGWD